MLWTVHWKSPSLSNTVIKFPCAWIGSLLLCYWRWNGLTVTMYIIMTLTLTQEHQLLPRALLQSCNYYILVECRKHPYHIWRSFQLGARNKNFIKQDACSLIVGTFTNLRDWALNLALQHSFFTEWGSCFIHYCFCLYTTHLRRTCLTVLWQRQRTPCA